MPDVIYRNSNVKDKIISFVFVVMTIAIIIFSSFFIRPVYGLIVHLIIVIFTIFLLILWHSRKTAYLCQHCDQEFEISFWRDLRSPSLFSKKLLKCPNCGFKDWQTELVKNRSNKI